MSSSDEMMTVRLGRGLTTPWSISPPDYRVIGTIHRGMEFGLLALAPDQSYVQVNGSVIQALEADEINAAIRKIRSQRHATDTFFESVPSNNSRQATEPEKPVVIVRKKRRISLPAMRELPEGEATR